MAEGGGDTVAMVTHVCRLATLYTVQTCAHLKSTRHDPVSIIPSSQESRDDALDQRKNVLFWQPPLLLHILAALSFLVLPSCQQAEGLS